MDDGTAAESSHGHSAAYRLLRQALSYGGPVRVTYRLQVALFPVITYMPTAELLAAGS
jgi:hypothetical protein